MAHVFYPLGEQGVTVEWTGQTGSELLGEIHRCCFLLEQHPPRWLIDYVSAYATITVFYDPAEADEGSSPYEAVKNELIRLFGQAESIALPEARTIEIPICYGGEFGPDLSFVAAHAGLSEREVIDRHTQTVYTVAMIGFSPGFPFLEGMSQKLATPRKASPRLRIPARSVGIAGSQTGVYPIETPGGWQLIGRTPVRLFLPEEPEPFVLRAGDRVRFAEIDAAAYREQEARHAAHS